MHVTACYIRSDRRAAPERVDCLAVTAGYGIADDVHAHQHSSRQVLIASSRTYERLALPSATLRENILIDADMSSWSSGDAVIVGDSIIRITFRCEPCSRLERLRPGTARSVAGERGFLGRVVRSGIIAAGAEVSVKSGVFSPLSDGPRNRIDDILGALRAADRTTTATTLLVAAGAPRGYARALPAILKRRDDCRERVLFGRVKPLRNEWDPCEYFQDAAPPGACAAQSGVQRELSVPSVR